MEENKVVEEIMEPEVEEKKSRVRKTPLGEAGEKPANAVELNAEVKEKFEEAFNEIEKAAKVAKEKVAEKALEIKEGALGEDGKLDKEDIKRVSGEVKEKTEKKVEGLKERVLGEDGKLDKEDFRRIGNALLEVGASVAGLGKKGFAWLEKSLRSAEKDVNKDDAAK